MDEGIKVGDVVIVKSGGPEMTVAKVSNYSNRGIAKGALCIWFDGNKKCEEVFSI